MIQVLERRERVARVAVEGIVIVVSVLLAFGIDAWWDSRQQEAAEQEWIAALQLDLETSLGQLEEGLGTAEAAAGSARRLLTLLGSPQSPPVDSVRTLARGAIRPIGFTPTLPGLEAGFSQGRLTIVESVEFRRALADFRLWFTHFDDSRRLDWNHFFLGPLYDLRAPHGGLQLFNTAPPAGRLAMSDAEYLEVMLTPEAYSAFETTLLAQNNQIRGLEGMRETLRAMVAILQGRAR